MGKIRKKTRFISLKAGIGYQWCGRRLLTDEETWDGRYLKSGLKSVCNRREFKTVKKAMNVLMSCPKGKGFELLREYWIKQGKKVKPYYNFNSVADVEEYDQWEREFNERENTGGVG